MAESGLASGLSTPLIRSSPPYLRTPSTIIESVEAPMSFRSPRASQ